MRFIYRTTKTQKIQHHICNFVLYCNKYPSKYGSIRHSDFLCFYCALSLTFLEHVAQWFHHLKRWFSAQLLEKSEISLLQLVLAYKRHPPKRGESVSVPGATVILKFRFTLRQC